MFIGADVSALYPSLDQVETAAITANAVGESKVELEEIAYDELSVYLGLTIGKEGMCRWGVGHCLVKNDSVQLNKTGLV